MFSRLKGEFHLLPLPYGYMKKYHDMMQFPPAYNVEPHKRRRQSMRKRNAREGKGEVGGGEGEGEGGRTERKEGRKEEKEERKENNGGRT
jgi:hypothetical protein